MKECMKIKENARTDDVFNFQLPNKFGRGFVSEPQTRNRRAEFEILLTAFTKTAPARRET